jgi:serine/threonine-protein kinase
LGLYRFQHNSHREDAMALPDFEIKYQLSSPGSRQPRTTEGEIKAVFPGESPVRFLGAGAFGDTWRVGNRVVKVIVADTFESERIDREIQAAKLNAPNVVSLRDSATIFAAGEDRVALVFDYVKGRDLATVISSDGKFDEDDVRELAKGLLTGLQAIRAAGIIHRDIKPDNVQLRMDSPRKPVILDLGLVFIADATSLTVYPAAIGTRSFMPPEVLRGEQAVHRSDMYALGVTLFIAATGRHPFMADGETIRRSDLTPRIEKGVKLKLADAELRRLVGRMLHPQAFRRPSAARALDDLGA